MDNFYSLHEAIKKDKKLQMFCQLVEKICLKHQDKSPEEFYQTNEYTFIQDQLKLLKV